MQLKSGDTYTMLTNPELALALAQCETVEEEFEVMALFEYDETMFFAAQHKTSINTKE